MKADTILADGPERFDAAIAAAAARCLPGPGALDRDVPFSLLGLDSLRTIELAAELQDILGVALPDDLLDGCPDARSLASRLHRICTDGQPIAADPYQRMLADAVLPADVSPPRRRAAGPAPLGNARSILLTGATGFLGGALAPELLRGTAATLLCLVRPAAGFSAQARLRQQLLSAGVDGRVVDSRVRVVDGDLSKPRLGLDRAAFDALASGADAICHAGASVNWASTYDGLREANVCGTLELLRLACRTAIPFHFISSLSACCSTSAASDVDETFDPLPYLRGVHLGYAQTKVVAEALAREAEARGLPVRIYRPSLISGDSLTGAFNRDDILSRLIRGCVHMGTAPDLDWVLDALPVDVVARAILHLSATPQHVFHLAHRRPRHWRECVLWMRLYGYPLRLVSYRSWLRQLEDGTASSSAEAAAHPLRPLRGFFLNRPAAAGGLTLPELYEEGRRPRAHQRLTAAALDECRCSCPALDAALLEVYFAAFIRAGELPRPPRPSSSSPRASRAPGPGTCLDAGFLARVTGLDVAAVHPLGGGSDHSIVSELAGWRSRRPTGLFRLRIDVHTPGGPASRNVIVKVKPRDADVLDVGEALAHLCDARVAQAYSRWRDRLGLTGSHERELAIYRQTDPRFVRHAPQVLGILSDAAAERWVIVLEEIGDATAMDGADCPHAWTRERLAIAIDGLAALQAIWYGRGAELCESGWIGYVPSTGRMAEMTDLWTALADHATPAFSSWAGNGIAGIHRTLVSTIERWWPALERSPRTLIHHDFNPRNICLRGGGTATRLCAYDWELATVGAPQRDLAELLCFALPDNVAGHEIEACLDRHRGALARETGGYIEPETWRAGFGAALNDFLINRLATYALIHRVRRQRYLPRVVRTWRRIYAHLRAEAGS